jgi:hypothetical protein
LEMIKGFGYYAKPKPIQLFWMVKEIKLIKGEARP